MLLKTLPRGQSIVYKGRLPVERNILLRLAVKASFVGKEEEDWSPKSTGVGLKEVESRNTDGNIVWLESAEDTLPTYAGEEEVLKYCWDSRDKKRGDSWYPRDGWPSWPRLTRGNQWYPRPWLTKVYGYQWDIPSKLIDTWISFRDREHQNLIYFALDFIDALTPNF